MEGTGDNFCSRVGKLNPCTSRGDEVTGFSLPAVSSPVRIQESSRWCHLLITTLFGSACLSTFTVILAWWTGSQGEMQDGRRLCGYPCAEGAGWCSEARWWTGLGFCFGTHDTMKQLLSDNRDLQITDELWMSHRICISKLDLRMTALWCWGWWVWGNVSPCH